MKICIFCGDAFMSGSNMSLSDWVTEDRDNEYYIILPRKSNDFDGMPNNVKILYGNYFAITKQLVKKSLVENIKLFIKRIYMALFYKIFVRRKLISIVKKISPDVVISNTFSTWIGADIAETLGIKHIWHVREFMDLDHNIEHENIDFIKKLTEKSDAIFISDTIKNYYLKKYKFNRSTRIYNTIKYDSKIEKKYHQINSVKVKAIIVGQLTEGKGVFDAIKAAHLLWEDGYNFTLDIYGKGYLEDKIKRYIKDNDIENVNLVGFRKDINQLRKNYDMALVCSKMEALGRVTIEGMYYNNLVIGANTGATAELIKDGVTGYLYEEGDIKSLVCTIKKAITANDKSKIIIETAHKWSVDNFSKAIGSKIIKFIKNSED